MVHWLTPFKFLPTHRYLPSTPPTNIRKVRGCRKKYGQQTLTSKWKKGYVGVAKRFSKKYGNKGWAFNYSVPDELSTTLYLQMLHPYITASKTSSYNSVVRIQQKDYLVLCTVEEGMANTCIWLTMHPWSWKSTTLDRKEMAYTLQTPFCWLKAS